ncbi:MAG: hypothetical protein QOI32_2128 [Thermoleophilaceae bacterium]|jgi:hypothetical protein|nr:hypothetical protein [Thermoleophilaceae bacterium]
MATIPEVALQLLQADLQQLPERIRDEKFSRELYCALTNNRWSKDGEAIAMSWRRAENFVNALRRGHARPDLPLYSSGCEGTVDATIRQELVDRFGWSVEPLDTSEHDPVHVDDPPG